MSLGVASQIYINIYYFNIIYYHIIYSVKRINEKVVGGGEGVLNPGTPGRKKGGS